MGFSTLKRGPKRGILAKLAKMGENGAFWGVFDPPWKMRSFCKKVKTRFWTSSKTHFLDFPGRLLTAKIGKITKKRENARFWEIAGNVPRIRHLLERPRRTFLPHEGLQEPLFGGSTMFPHETSRNAKRSSAFQ
jgi:hypothetical protein